MLALLFVAISLGLSNFAAIGRSLASTFSHAAHSIGVASEGAHS